MGKKNVLPEGTRDLILTECIIKRQLEKDVDQLFNKWGYKEVITPTVEYYETFNNNSNTLREEDMYKFFDNKGSILVLRPDMTVPIARVVETKLKDTELPIKLRYNSNIFRVHKSLGGKRNEYTDIGVELIGLNGKQSDLEIIVLALEALKKLGLKDFKVEIGNIGFFNSAFANTSIDEEYKTKIAKFIDEKNLKSLEEYLEDLDIKDEHKMFFNKLPWMFGGKSILKKAKELAFNYAIKENVEYLERLYSDLEELGCGDNITFDLGMIPRLNYYTGIIFKGYCDGVGTTVLRGGRYDNLIKPYKNYLPAVGFSIDINSVMPIVEVKDILKDQSEAYVVFYSEKNKIEAIKKSQELRMQGYIVELMPNDTVEELKIVKKGEK